jgi:hypothetical protein
MRAKAGKSSSHFFPVSRGWFCEAVPAPGSPTLIRNSIRRFCRSQNAITKVTFTPSEAASNIQLVVWQFWGRAAEASWTERSRTLFLFALASKSIPSARGPDSRIQAQRHELFINVPVADFQGARFATPGFESEGAV